MFSRIDFVNAIDADDADKAQSLLKSGAVRVDDRLPRDNAPGLVLAVRGGRRAIVEVLLQHGANVNAATRLGETACHAAAERDDTSSPCCWRNHRPICTCATASLALYSTRRCSIAVCELWSC